MGDSSEPSSAKSRLVQAMDRLDRLMAELDDAVDRLDERTPAPEPPGPPPRERTRARWYWTLPADTAPPAPDQLSDVAEVSPPP